MNASQLSGLARQLVTDNIIDEEEAINATETSKKEGRPFISVLVEQSNASALHVASSAAREFGLPLIDVAALDLSALPDDIVADKLVEKHHVMPLHKRGNRLYIAVSDPTNFTALEDIKFQTGLNIESILVEEDKLAKAITAYIDKKQQTLGDLDDEGLDDLDIESGEPEAKDDDDDSGTDDAPIVRFINKILLDAIKIGASDLHFEPYEKSYRIRFRVDGILQEVARPPVNLTNKMAARLKVMSKMDISERRVPQDGRIKLKLSKSKSIDFRVNSCPTLWGEKLCLRILDSDSASLGIDILGYEDDQKKLYLEALEKPQGMILVTGPTGSGKTVSLYTGLAILNTEERNISTAEDPVEINLEGVNQVNVNAKVGLDFGAALKSFLRQDPDIVMVGEIRDLETAEIAIKAAQTGHLVLSTLHTNSAPETLTRLRNMGVPSFNIATSVALIIAQRLARRLCDCKKELDVPKEALLETGFTEEDIATGFKVFGPVGCERCNDGYKGRVGIYEVVKNTNAIQRCIMEDGNAIQIADIAREEGFPDLKRSGLVKVMNGMTSLAEVNRVTTGH
jgi:type IV pilus assembly protein PilB